MVRGGGFGGFGGGGQLLEMIGSLLAMPSDDLLRLAIGLALMLLIIVQMRRVSPPRPRPVQRSTTCLVCQAELGAGQAYVDRYFPNWVACAACYRKLTPVQQRQYRPDQ